MFGKLYLKIRSSKFIFNAEMQLLLPPFVSLLFNFHQVNKTVMYDLSLPIHPFYLKLGGKKDRKEKRHSGKKYFASML